MYRPARLKTEELKAGYEWAYRAFYKWSAIAQASFHHGAAKHAMKHFFYASGWKKFEPVWDILIRARQLTHVTPLLEAVLSRVTSHRSRWGSATKTTGVATPDDSDLVQILNRS